MDDEEEYFDRESPQGKKYIALQSELRVMGFDAAVWHGGAGMRVYINGIRKPPLGECFSTFSEEDLVNFKIYVEIEEKYLFVHCYSYNERTKVAQLKAREIQTEVENFLSEMKVHELIQLSEGIIKNMWRRAIDKKTKRNVYADILGSNTKSARPYRLPAIISSIVIGVLLGIFLFW